MSNTSYTLFISFVINVFLASIKLILGYITKFNALIADSIHTFSDLSTDLMAIINDNRIEKDKVYPYLYSKRERIINIFTGIFIILLGLFIIYKSMNKKIIIPPIYLTYICLLILIIKYILYKYLKNKSILYNEQILKVNANESYMDIISTIIVLISIILMNLSIDIEVLKYSDKIATILIVLLIIKESFNTIADNITGLLGKIIKDENYINKLTYNINILSKNIKLIDINIIKYSDTFMVNTKLSINDKLSLNDASIITKQIELVCKKYDKRIKHVIVDFYPTNF